MITFPLITPKLWHIKKYYKKKPITILDIGSGNRSAIFTKKHIPNCTYYGLDIIRDYNYDEKDFGLMQDFYELDLTKLNFDTIPDDFFDAIIIAHVLEHLPNGEDVLMGLTKKLKKGGVFYIEFPGKISLSLPSMKGTLNFYDDPTHVRVYSHTDIAKLLLDNSFSVIKSGTRRSKLQILAIPFKMVYYIFKKYPIQGSLFWDLTGFAEFVFAAKR
jgi:SAM-dependent methyltransferase